MKLTLTIKAPPFSVNSAYYRASHTRTMKCRKWGDAIQLQLLQEPAISALRAFKSAYNGQNLTVSLTFYHTLYKVINYEISRQSQDLSNVEKLLIDLIFDSRFDGRMIGPKAEHTVETLCIDDKNIVKLTSRKKQRKGSDSYVVVEIETIEPDHAEYLPAPVNEFIP